MTEDEVAVEIGVEKIVVDEIDTIFEAGVDVARVIDEITVATVDVFTTGITNRDGVLLSTGVVTGVELLRNLSVFGSMEPIGERVCAFWYSMSAFFVISPKYPVIVGYEKKPSFLRICWRVETSVPCEPRERGRVKVIFGDVVTSAEIVCDLLSILNTIKETIISTPPHRKSSSYDS